MPSVFFFSFDTLSAGPLSKVHADPIGDTSHQGSVSRVRQSVASETSRLVSSRLVSSVVTQPTIRCYDLSLWELNNFHRSCFHGSISLYTLHYFFPAGSRTPDAQHLVGHYTGYATRIQKPVLVSHKIHCLSVG
jgi:hypothetical protein